MQSADDFVSVYKSASEAILSCAEKITTEEIAQLIEFYRDLTENSSSLFFCGVGKSGLIGEKMASTFSSLGLPAFFLHPIEALHGDLGRIRPGDGLVLISKSGTTEEILKLLPYLPLPKEKIIGLIGDTNSAIANKCSLVFDCSVSKEACIHNKAPTTSTTVTMVCADAMAVIFEKYSGLSAEQFASNHPGGILGKSLRLKVQELMVQRQDCAEISSQDSLKAALLAMTQKPVGICCVVDGDELKGILGEADVRRFFTKDEAGLETSIAEVMNGSPKFINASSLALEAFKLMENPSRPFYQLPVVEDNRFVGVLRMHDLLKEGF